jgi:hypothetical protein
VVGGGNCGATRVVIFFRLRIVFSLNDL